MSIYIGVNGVAKKIISGYAGDSSGNAQVIYKSGIVPSGYIPVEYIFNDHASLNKIDTGIIPTTYTRLIVKMSIGGNLPTPQVLSDSYRQFVGNSNITIDIQNYQQNKGDWPIYRKITFKCGVGTNTISFGFNNIYIFDFNRNANKETYLNNELKYTNTSTFTGTDSIKLFNSGSQRDIRLYSCSIYQSMLTGILTREYIPCLKIEGEVAGLYETQTGTFYSGENENSHFSAGPIITE